MNLTATCAIVLAVSVLSSGDPQRTEPVSSSPSQNPEPPPFRVSVDVVRVDAVVTDRNGHLVPDLTAEDFEVLQDGKRQKVTFSQFVPVVSRSASGAAAVTSPLLLRREQVQRTFAVVVDDLGLSFESLYYMQRALHAFIDRDTGPADLVAIMRTGGSAGLRQPFTTDRRVLHAAVDGLRWSTFSRSRSTSPALKDFVSFDKPGLSELSDFSAVDALRGSMSAAGTLVALNRVVQRARELPGRKAVILVSEGFSLGGVDPDVRVRAALDRLMDEAMRAGIVIYAVDARGLQTVSASDTQEPMAYLAEQTGGFAVLNTNDLAYGLRRIANDVRDYYVIGYVPDEGTFVSDGRKPRLHTISIKAKRPGLRVKTRKEFHGVSDGPEASRPATPAQELDREAGSGAGN